MYIEINLLPKEFRPKRSKLSLDFKALLVLLLICGAVALGGYYYYLSFQYKSQVSELNALKQQQILLQGAVELNDKVANLKAKVSERIEIIKELTQDSDLRFEMLRHINRIMPENLWLVSLTENDQGNGVYYTIEGMSYTKAGISSFLVGLNEFEHFTEVTLEAITPSPMEIQDAYQYVVQVKLATYNQPEVADASTKNKK